MSLKKTFKTALKTIGWIIISGLFLLIVLVFLALQSSPHIINRHTVDVTAATKSKAAAKRLIESVKSKKQPVIIELSQLEADGLSALANRAFPQTISDFYLTQDQASFDLSVKLPLPTAIKYLNVSGSLLASDQGLSLGTVHIGSLMIPGDFMLWAGETTVNVFVQEGLGSTLTSMIQWVELGENNIKSSLSLPKEMTQLKDQKSGLLILRDKLSVFGDVEHIKFYHQNLVNIIDKNGRFESQRLSYYLQRMFLLAKQQTEHFQIDDATSAVKENYAALMALSLYFGSDSFELLVGDISNLNNKQLIKRQKLQRKVKLQNRVDLQKHFVYSAALQLFGTTTASDTIGEFKEFLDSNPGGSGFSFADLTADRAGTRLAQLATRSEALAKHVQLVFSGEIKESDFMPDISGVPEGISAQVFEKEYRNVESQNYQKMLQYIDGQLAARVLYQ